jgi:hypothetical protein
LWWDLHDLLELTVAGGEIGATFGLADHRELVLDALQRCSGLVGFVLPQRRVGLVEFGPDRSRRLHRAGVVAVEHVGYAPQVVTGLRGLGDQAHRGQGDH